MLTRADIYERVDSILKRPKESMMVAEMGRLIGKIVDEVEQLQELAHRYVKFCEESMDEDEMAPESREIMNGFKSLLQKPGG